MMVEMQHDRNVRHEFATARLALRLVDADDVEDLLAYERRNRSRLAPWEPWRDPALLEDVSRRRLDLARLRAEADADRTYSFIARDADGTVVARVTLSNVVRGAFQACHLGYSVDGPHEGKGVAFEAVGAVVRFAFEELRLHRVMANYQPTNHRSGNLLIRLGFEIEGSARNYLYIDREWRDHILTAIINPDESNAPP
jgi:ribosomal-protein-alanine N-acetyltransferase